MAELNEEQRKPRTPRDKRPNKEMTRREESEFDKTLVAVRRVTKVVKGGRTMRFSALVVVGDRKGTVGIGMGRASEVPGAIDKATQNAKKNLKKINLVGNTIPHEITGKYSTCNILLMPGKEGCGVIAGGSARAVLELAGIKDIVTKIHGTTNKINAVKATINGLMALKTKEQIAARRGLSVEEI